MNRRLHMLFGIKWNPFLSDAPVDSLFCDARLQSFLTRVEHLCEHGGYAVMTGAVGTGKSAALRILQRSLSKLPDLSCVVLTRPHGAVNDFYRELGGIFGVSLNPCNRWGGARTLRERWLAHIEESGKRAVLLIDEAQSSRDSLLNELRLLVSHELDAKNLLTIVLAGDERLVDRLRTQELLPLGSRVRVRLALPSRSAQEMMELLDHLLEQASANQLFTAEVKDALVGHSSGNPRVLMHLGAELLDTAIREELNRIDEKLFFRVFEPMAAAQSRKATARGRVR